MSNISFILQMRKMLKPSYSTLKVEPFSRAADGACLERRRAYMRMHDLLPRARCPRLSDTSFCTQLLYALLFLRT